MSRSVSIESYAAKAANFVAKLRNLRPEHDVGRQLMNDGRRMAEEIRNAKPESQSIAFVLRNLLLGPSFVIRDSASVMNRGSVTRPTRGLFWVCKCRSGKSRPQAQRHVQ